MSDAAKGLLLATRISLVRDELEAVVFLGRDDELWTKLVAIGPYALPVVLTMARDMTPSERAAFIDLVIKSIEANVVDPEQTRAFNQLAQ